MFPLGRWSEYARLRDKEGWTQQRIAKAKGVDQGRVSKRLKMHGLSEQIKEFMRQGLLKEGHLEEIISLCVDAHFSSWLTTEQAWEELAEWAAGGKGFPQSAGARRAGLVSMLERWDRSNRMSVFIVKVQKSCK